MKKQAIDNQIVLATLNEGVSAAKVEATRLKNLITKALKLVEKSSQKENLYKEAGDIIVALPKRLQYLETYLDKTLYALALVSSDHLKSHIPQEDRHSLEEVLDLKIK